MSPLVILLLVVIALAVYVVSIYNGLQRLKTQIVASIQEIGNQLKRQAALIPNLESTVKGYLKHEKGIFEMLSEARKAVAKADKTGSPEDVDAAIEQMQNLIPRFSVAVEDNPEMKSDASISRFMQELTDTADKLMYARRAVIDLSQEYNEKLVMFPSNIVASMFGFKEEKGLATPQTGAHVEVSTKEMQDPKVNL
ncbi:MAG: LemA family protein [Patescibacteria group bacterium]